MGWFDSKQKSSVTNSAAEFVQPHLTNSVNNYGSLPTPEAYGPNWQAGLNPNLSNSWDQMNNNPYGNQYQQNMAGWGNQAMTAMGNALADPNGQFKYNQGVYDQTMGNLMPAMQGTYDAATRDNNRQLNWSTLPGIDMGQSFSGQQGSTKGGQQSALAQSMTGDRNADIGASIYQNAVNQANSNAMSSGSQNLNAQMGMYGMGQDALNSAYGMNQGNIGMANNAGTQQQNFDQQGVDLSRAQWDAQQQNPWIYEGMRLQNLTNTGSAFGTTTNTSTNSPGLGNVALQLGSAYLSGGGGNPFTGFTGGGGGGGFNPGLNSGAVTQNTNNGYYGSGPGGGLIPDYNF